MRRSGVTKFPNSIQLFKFCQKVLMDKRGGKVHDQEVGAILSFNPSDCSHWKRGEKNVKSVFSLAKLAKELQIETSLIHEIASGHIGLEEAYYEHRESSEYKGCITRAQVFPDRLAGARKKVADFVQELFRQAEFSVPPLYLPEILRHFSFISTQPIEMMDRLSRVLRVKPGQYVIQFRKGELKAQTRMSIAKDLARIPFEAEREKFSDKFGDLKEELVGFEELLFTADLLAPKDLLLAEMSKLDSRKNLVADLATIFWVPKSLIGFQLQDIIRSKKAMRLEMHQVREEARKVEQSL